MIDIQDPEKDPFLLTLDNVVRQRAKEKQLTLQQLAQTLGPHYRVLSYWLTGQRKLPADILPRLCAALENYDLLDLLERQAGRVAFQVPKIESLPKIEDVRAVQRLVKEVGEALQSLANTLEDGIVEKPELDQTIPELDDVIRECAQLKHWLHEHYRADHAPRPRDDNGGRRPYQSQPAERR